MKHILRNYDTRVIIRACDSSDLPKFQYNACTDTGNTKKYLN